MSLLQSTDQLFVIAGSCGLQLLLDGLEWLEGSDEMSCKRIEVIALGPVASHDLVIKNKNRAETDACRLRLTTVQGTADWISRPFCRHPDIRISHLGHLGYWQSDKVREIVHSWLHNRLSVLSELEATCLNDDFPQKISTSG